MDFLTATKGYDFLNAAQTATMKISLIDLRVSLVFVCRAASFQSSFPARPDVDVKAKGLDRFTTTAKTSSIARINERS